MLPCGVWSTTCQFFFIALTALEFGPSSSSDMWLSLCTVFFPSFCCWSQGSCSLISQLFDGGFLLCEGQTFASLGQLVPGNCTINDIHSFFCVWCLSAMCPRPICPSVDLCTSKPICWLLALKCGLQAITELSVVAYTFNPITWEACLVFEARLG